MLVIVTNYCNYYHVPKLLNFIVTKTELQIKQQIINVYISTINTLINFVDTIPYTVHTETLAIKNINW